MLRLDPAAELVIDDIIRNRGYGTIELRFAAGRLVLIRKEETLKPSNQPKQSESEEK